MDLKAFHDTVTDITRKQRESIPAPEEIDRLINLAQTETFEEYKAFYANNQQAQDALSPFKSSFALNNGNTPGGVVTFPDDYAHLLSISLVWVDTTGRTRHSGIEVLGDDEIDGRLDSALMPPSVDYPVCVFTSNGVEVYPSQPLAGKLSYLHKPKDVEFVYTVSADEIQYNQGASSQLEWREPATAKILYKTLTLLGCNMQDPMVMQLFKGKDDQFTATERAA